jgi:heme-degrading monooxygenase HmoA
MMFLVQGVHYPDANKERALIEAMHTFGALVRTQPGALFVDVFRNASDGTILSLAIWESKQAFQTAWATLAPRVPSQEWEVEPREMFMMESV